MPASGFMSASSATPDSSPKMAIAVYSALTAMYRARRFRKEKVKHFSAEAGQGYACIQQYFC